jgi:hypothetical protein
MPSLADQPIAVLAPRKFRLWFRPKPSSESTTPPSPPDQPPQSTQPDRHHLKTDRLNFGSAPALFAACCFASGILAAKFVWHPAFFLIVLCLSAAALAAASMRSALRAALVPLKHF